MPNDGLARLQRRLAAIPKDVKKAVGPALLKSAEEIADSQRSLAPVRTGALRDSITVTPAGQQTPPYSEPGGSQTVPDNGAMITAGDTDVRYAHLVEYGTKHSAAEPYFWPAYRLHKKTAQRRIKRAMTKAIKQKWGK